MRRERMHHERARQNMGDYIVVHYWCGLRSMTEEVTRDESGRLVSINEKELPPLSDAALKNPDIHCVKCLKKKQFEMGAIYMRSQGFPVFEKGQWQ